MRWVHSGIIMILCFTILTSLRDSLPIDDGDIAATIFDVTLPLMVQKIHPITCVLLPRVDHVEDVGVDRLDLGDLVHQRLATEDGVQDLLDVEGLDQVGVLWQAPVSVLHSRRNEELDLTGPGVAITAITAQGMLEDTLGQADLALVA